MTYPKSSQEQFPTSLGDLPESTVKKINQFLQQRDQPIFNRSLIHTINDQNFISEVKSEEKFFYRGMINKAPTLCAHCKHLNKQLHALNLFSQHNLVTEVLLLNENFEPIEICLKHHEPELIK